ncbi:MAG: PHP domain-containing protein [Tissierellales bacterium]|nr:PHP domain-containing protein [Tissierellales bacterium]MBN2827385.1 PHP domain-containing protein [Tissierellales bacterium]
MIIDLHYHTKEYSSCSNIDMEEGIRVAKEIGLDGICLTEHDIFASRKKAKVLQEKYNILVVVGIEILTFEGDIVCFGLEKAPERMMHAIHLVEMVNSANGVAIAAHPFRNNNRGLGYNIRNILDIHAIESFNGNTDLENNLKAVKLAQELSIPQTGGSDAHRLDRTGIFATKFERAIKNERELIEEIKAGRMNPWFLSRRGPTQNTGMDF